MRSAIAGGRYRLMARAAQLYYLEDRTMAAIADDLHMSRSSVSRMLTLARSTGLVEIRLNFDSDRPKRLEAELAARHRVAAHVVPLPDRSSNAEQLDRVAFEAAQLLTRLRGSHLIMGVAWGSTVDAVSRQLQFGAARDGLIVQMNGAGTARLPDDGKVNAMLGRFARAFEARVQPFPAPAFFDSPLTKESAWHDHDVRRAVEVRGRMDVALFGLGSPESDIPGRVYSEGYLRSEDLRALANTGVVGDVATVFYREDGSSSGIPLNLRGSGPELDRLRHVPRRIGVAAGVGRLRSIRGALAGGLMTDLVVDESAARALLEGAEEGG